MIPSVSITKSDGGTGVVRPTDVGNGAIISTSESGTANQAEQFLNVTPGLAEFGGGALIESTAYAMAVSGNPMLLVKGTATTAGAYGTVALTGSGASVPTGDGSVKPLDDYSVLITVTLGGTVGTGPISYTYSLDGGRTTSAVQSLGTTAYILIPNSGVKIDLTTATLVAGDTIACTTTGPKNTNADLVNALEALRVSRSPFEIVYYDGPADATTVSDADTWLQAMEATGRFKTFICTARARHATGETEAQYATALAAIFASSHSLSVVVCADVGEVSSPIPNRGTTACIQARPVGLAVFARALSIPIGEDPAYVARGPVAQFNIADSRGGPKYHDEFINPGLDTLRLTTLRSFDGRQGSYITNANVLSPTGSDYVYLQQVRTINRACEIAYEILSNALSRGVRKSPKVGPSGERYIAEGAALQIEQLCNSAISAELNGQVDGIKFVLSRTDDISSNSGATVTGGIQDVSLAYLKKFSVTAGFTKALT